MSLPAILVYARISSLFPGKNLYEIFRIVFGGFAGALLKQPLYKAE